MAGLRQRPVPGSNPPGSNTHSASPSVSAQGSRRTAGDFEDEDEDEGPGITVVDIIRVLATLIVASCGLSYYMTSSESLLWGYRPWITRWPVLVRYFKGPLNLPPAQLALYNGTDPSLPIYLAVNGSIFDVSANRRVYGPGGSYNFFAGRDATRAFVTGCFKEDLTSDLTGVEEMFIPIDSDEDIRDLTPSQREIRREQDVKLAKANVDKVVSHWENFFRSHKKYFQVGKVIWGGEESENVGKRELCEAARKGRPKRREV